jgi:nicotinamidase-related amidase
MTDPRSARSIIEQFDFGETYLQRVADAAQTARAAAIPVLYLRIAFRPDAPEVGPNRPRFAAFAQTMPEHDPATAIHPAVAPHSGEIVITRRRPSAFTGTDLELILRSQAIDHLILTGNATSGGILFTLLAAADRDFQLTVLTDCCADFDATVHDFLIDRLIPPHAQTTTLEDWRIHQHTLT